VVLSGVDASLFGGAQQASTLAVLAKAVSAAASANAASAGSAPLSVLIRRVRDMTNPEVPVVVYLNPQFANDFSPKMQQRRQLGGASGSSVAVDTQIQLLSNAAAASLSAALAAAPGALAAGVLQSLVSQGSSLAGASVSATVEPYAGAGPQASIGDVSSGTSSSLTSILIGGITTFIAAVVLVISAGVYMRYMRRRQAVAADNSENTEAAPSKQLPSGSLHLRTPGSDGAAWRAWAHEALSIADIDFLVALGALDEDGRRIGAVALSAEARARFSRAELERLFKFGVVRGSEGP
jgi:hypothetical protein